MVTEAWAFVVAFAALSWFFAVFEAALACSGCAFTDFFFIVDRGSSTISGCNPSRDAASTTSMTAASTSFDSKPCMLAGAFFEVLPGFLGVLRAAFLVSVAVVFCAFVAFIA